MYHAEQPFVPYVYNQIVPLAEGGKYGAMTLTPPAPPPQHTHTHTQIGV
jgi:hypothetical protein